MLLLFISSLASCSGTGSTTGQPGQLQVIATTTIVSDVVQQVAGGTVQVATLLPPGTDPHSFQPTPQDVALVSKANLIFASGAGLETFLQPLLDNAGGNAQVVYLSQGIPLLEAEDVTEKAAESGETGEQGQGDPHVWLDPTNVITWTNRIEETLAALAPQDEQAFAKNAQAYIQQLQELDTWIQEQVAKIPQGNRLLVSDHTDLTYFAKRYGFEQVGSIIPGYSTLAEASAQDLAALEDAIRKQGVKTIFISETAPAVVQRVAQDTGISLVQLYIGYLSPPDGPAPTYMKMMRYDVNQIVSALS